MEQLAGLVILQCRLEAEAQDQEGQPLPERNAKAGAVLRRMLVGPMGPLGSLRRRRPEGQGEKGGEAGGQRRSVPPWAEQAGSGLQELRVERLGGVGQVQQDLRKRSQDEEKEDPGSPSQRRKALRQANALRDCKV